MYELIAHWRQKPGNHIWSWQFVYLCLYILALFKPMIKEVDAIPGTPRGRYMHKINRSTAMSLCYYCELATCISMAYIVESERFIVWAYGLVVPCNVLIMLTIPEAFVQIVWQKNNSSGRQISWSLEAVRLDFTMMVSFENWQVSRQRCCLSNSRAIRKV